MISFFTCPKKNNNITDIHQKNSFLSIKNLKIPKELLVFDQFNQYHHEPGINIINEFESNEFETPYISNIFKKAIEESKYDYLIYFNSDIIFDDSLSNTINLIVTNQYDKFLAFGKRYDIDFNDNITENKLNLIKEKIQNLKMHNKFGIDYFIFNKKNFFDLKGFLIGRTCWDNWMIYECNKRSYKLVDLTGKVNCFHQNHDFSHIKSKNNNSHYKGTERDYNYNLSGGHKYLFNIDDSNYILEKGKFLKKNFYILIKRKITNTFERNIRQILNALKKSTIRKIFNF